MSSGHQYESPNISGQATAILGNKYGDVINIQQATFLLQATPSAHANSGSSKTVRHNQILPGGQTTVESIKTYNESDHFRQRGAVEEIELRWERCEDLGVGSFGDVHREQTESHGQTKSRAVKVLRRRHLKHMGVDHKKELDALIDLSQPHVVHRFVEFYSWYESHDNIYLAMEYIPHGDLEAHIRTGLTELDARQIAYQVLDGMRIMHDLDLSHRDIKPANIFVVQKEPVWWVKLGDFSICKRSMTRQTVLRTQVGTQGYQAPEVLGLVDTEKKDVYDSKCDIWSYGCLVFEMLTKQLPFPTIRTLNDYCNDEIPFPGVLVKDAGGSLLFAEFAWSLLQANPLARPTADQALFLLSHRCESKTASAESPEDPKFLYLKDCIGRHFKIPWQHCSRWIDIVSTLKTLLSHIQRDGIGERVSRGLYFMSTSQGIRLHSHNWTEIASAGVYIFMSMESEVHNESPAYDNVSDNMERTAVTALTETQSPDQQAIHDAARKPTAAPTILKSHGEQIHDEGSADADFISETTADEVQIKHEETTMNGTNSAQDTACRDFVLLSRDSLASREGTEKSHSRRTAQKRPPSPEREFLRFNAPSSSSPATPHPTHSRNGTRNSIIEDELPRPTEPMKTSIHTKKPDTRPTFHHGVRQPSGEQSKSAATTRAREASDREGIHESDTDTDTDTDISETIPRDTLYAEKARTAEDYIKRAMEPEALAWREKNRNAGSSSTADFPHSQYHPEKHRNSRKYRSPESSPTRDSVPSESEVPTYIRVDVKYLYPETLEAYGLPWDYDPRNNNYLFIKQLIGHELQNELFRHTRKIIRQRKQVSLEQESAAKQRKTSAEKIRGKWRFFR